MVKILITHFYSRRNLGDAAIAQTIIGWLKKNYPDTKIQLLSMDRTQKTSSYCGVPETSSFFYQGVYSSTQPLIRAVKSTYILTSTSLVALCGRWLGININFLLTHKVRDIYALYQMSPVHLATGGGYLTKVTSPSRLVTMLFHLHSFFISKILGKKLILLPQSIGPFENRLIETLSKIILNQADAIIVRDRYSRDYLQQLGVTQPEIYQTTDVCFSAEPVNRSLVEKLKQELPLAKPLIGLTVKNLYPDGRQRTYEEALAATINQLQAQRQIQVVLIPQVTDQLHQDDDRHVLGRIYSHIVQKHQVLLIDNQPSVDEVKAIYANLDFLLATRMHSAIFAVIENIPTISLAYEQKCFEIFRELGLSDWVIPVDKISQVSLTALFEKLYQDKTAYLNQLNKNLPGLRRQSLASWSQVSHLSTNSFGIKMG